MADDLESPKLDRTLGLEIVRVTEATAIAAARLRGRGDEAAADSAAITAMYRELARLPLQGVIVVGEGEESEAPLLYICLLYTSPSPRDRQKSRMPSSA